MANIQIERTVPLNAAGQPEFLQGTLYATENQAHEFILHATQGGEAVTLSGTVTANFIRPDNETVVMQGTVEDGAAHVTLAQSCYTQTGRFTLTVFVTIDQVKTALYCLTGNVKQTTTDTIVDPGNVIPDISDIIAEYAAMQQAVTDANAAADNANAAASHAVRYDTAQTLTDAQKAQARTNMTSNIDVGLYADDDGYICQN